MEKDLGRRCAVHFCRFVQALVDSEYSCQQQDRCVPEPHQEIHVGNHCPRAEGTGQKFVGCPEKTDLHQHRIDRTGFGKQGEEQHCKGGSHDQVGHVDDRLEKLFAPEPQGRVRKPRGKNQRHNDLGNKSHDPHDHGIFKIL